MAFHPCQEGDCGRFVRLDSFVRSLPAPPVLGQRTYLGYKEIADDFAGLSKHRLFDSISEESESQPQREKSSDSGRLRSYM